MKEKMTKKLSITTPENIQLEFPLALPGARISAFLVDLLWIGFSIVILYLVFAFLGSALGLGTQGNFVLLALLFLIQFLIRNGYFIYFELKYGATPGKKGQGFKVVSSDGSFLPASAIYVRNLLREVEVWLPFQLMLVIAFSGGTAFANSSVYPFLWVLLLGLFPFFEPKKRRLGDLLAGTVVILTSDTSLDQDLVKESRKKKDVTQYDFGFSEDHLDVYGKEELQVLEDILRRSPDMPYRERRKLLKTLVDKITRKIGYDKAIPRREHLNFLNQFYEAQRELLEKKLLRGRSLERKSRRHRRKRPRRR